MDLMFLILLGFFIFFLILHRKKSSKSGREINVTEEDIIDCLKNGYKINAIKHFRDLHGVSLSEAKRAIEEMQKDMIDRSIEK